MVEILLVILLLIRRVYARIEFGDDASLTQIDVLRTLSTVDIITRIGVECPHLVEVKSLGILRVLVRTLSVLTVDVGSGVRRVHA